MKERKTVANSQTLFYDLMVGNHFSIQFFCIMYIYKVSSESYLWNENGIFSKVIGKFHLIHKFIQYHWTKQQQQQIITIGIKKEIILIFFIGKKRYNWVIYLSSFFFFKKEFFFTPIHTLSKIHLSQWVKM